MYRFVFAVLTLALLLAACSGPAATPALPTEIPPTPTSPPPAASPTPKPTEDLDTPVTAEPGDAGTPAPQPWEPQPGDKFFERGTVFLDGVEVVVLESFPLQVRLHLEGSRPTPCHALRVVVAPPDAGNTIAVEVYTVVDPGQACIQVLAPFDETVPLGSFPTAEHPSGTYTVVVNGEKAGEFTA
jgi:hypothetical protein